MVLTQVLIYSLFAYIFYLLNVLNLFYFYSLLIFASFWHSRPVESCTRVGEVKYLKHFLAVACSAALSRRRMVAIGY